MVNISYPSYLHINEDLEFDRRSGIYKCTCLENECEYIGQAKDLLKRKGQHVSMLKHNNHYNKHLQRAYNQYGEDSFVWSIIEHCPENELDEAERYYIEKYDTHRYGFNQTDGGDGTRGYKQPPHVVEAHASALRKYWTPERREKRRNEMLGENNPMYGRTGALNPAYGKDHSGNFNGMYGKSQSQESKEKNRQAHLGANNVCSIPIICVETGEIFSSMGEAGRVKQCSDTTICKVCKGVKKTAGGYHWRYATEEEKRQYKLLNNRVS